MYNQASPLLCQLGNSTHEQMMGYVLRTPEGKIIVIDGGTEGDTDNLLACIRKVSGQEVPHIDAWFLTHAHRDHINAFMEIRRNRRETVTVERIYYNFPSIQFVERNEPQSTVTIRDFYALLPLFADRACIVTAGDSYQVGDAKFDVLFTMDPTLTDNCVNDSTSVFRLTVGGKTVLFLGDLGWDGGKKLLSMHGDTLKSDYCQMAHHGQRGVEEDVYQAIAPTVCLWCAPDWLYDNNAGKGYNTHFWKTVTVRSWMEKLGVTQHVVEKDGNRIIEL